MPSVPAREPRSDTAAALRRVAGEEVDVLQDNRPVVRSIPLRRWRRWIAGSGVIAELERLGPDPTGPPAEFRQVLAGTTDDLPW